MTNPSKPTVKVTARMKLQAQDQLLLALRSYIEAHIGLLSDAEAQALTAQYIRIEKLFS